MQFLVYLFSYPFLWLISKLHFRLLYVFSDGVFFLVYHIIGYRKHTVRKNISLTLPHLSLKEQRVIEKKSFRHMCDMFLETIKTMSISRSEIDKRFSYSNLDVYLDLEKKGKSIAIMISHYASYEWCISLNHQINHEGFAIYKKINNKYFDQLVRDIRSRFKATLITTKETRPIIEENFKNNKLGIYGFASDQSPKLQSTHHWNTFMGIEVPIQTGAEMLAKTYDMNVVFINIQKIKRGFYEATFEVLSDDISKVPNYQISDTFMKLVEKQIYNAPEFYFWSHKRWKHRR
jgi:Kdo2-lipid IVA lauroyltransferase/acyltransferase